MRIFFITKKNLIYFAIFILSLFLSSILYFSFANSNNDIRYPYVNQNDIYENKEKIAYLTFDDGPNKIITPKVLDILNKNNVKANFFIIGKYAEDHPEIVKDIYDNGHFIGNHSYSHNNSILYKDKETFFSEIEKTDKAIGKAIGNFNFHSHIFRCPNGSMSKIKYSQKQKCLKCLAEIDYTFVDWNVLNNDSMRKYTKNELLNNLKKSSSNKGSIIILMHDSGDVNKTYDVLEGSINYLKDEGYEFRTFYDFIQ